MIRWGEEPMKTKLVALCCFLFTMAVAAVVNAAGVADAVPVVLPDAPTMIDIGSLGAWAWFLSVGCIAATQLLRLPMAGEWMVEVHPIWKRVWIVGLSSFIAVSTGFLRGLSFDEILPLATATVLEAVGQYELILRPILKYGKRKPAPKAMATMDAVASSPASHPDLDPS